MIEISNRCSKEKFIEKHKGKSPEELSELLYKAEQKIADYKEIALGLRRSIKSCEKRKELLESQNMNMATVLKENGIRPHQLLITYEDDKVINESCCCECGETVCEECDNFITNVKSTESMAFYTVSITDGDLDGITADFRRENFQVLVVDDWETGVRIWDKFKKWGKG